MKQQSGKVYLDKDACLFREYITGVLNKVNQEGAYSSFVPADALSFSSVLFLLGHQYNKKGLPPEICLILTKRSKKIKQSGDLCCPGGKVAPGLDPILARLLTLPGFPVARWPHWSQLLKRQPEKARRLSLFFATSLRESFEELRLNPLGIRFLGPLPEQRLYAFKRTIYPMVCWIVRQKRFISNCEVEKVVYIPLRDLLNLDNYACYKIKLSHLAAQKFQKVRGDYSCFLYKDKKETDILWGVTFRIVMLFLKSAFGFKPPEISSLPVVIETLDNNYFTGKD